MAVGLVSNPDLPLDSVVYGDLRLANPYHLPAFSPLGPATASIRYLLAMVLVVALVMLLLRYREASAGERRQIRWVLFGTSAAVALGIMPFVIAPILWPGSLGHGGWLFVSTGALLLIPASVVIAVEQPRWLDTDAVIRKSLVYGALTVGIFGIYAAVAAGLGLAAGARLPVELAIVLTAVLAIAFQPTRSRMQLVADRMVFGSRPSAIEAVAGFEEAVRMAQDPGEIGSQLAELVRTAARLHWVTVEIPPAEPRTVGNPVGEPAHIEAITRNDDEFGRILCGPRIAGPFGDRERDLVRALAGQAGLILANLRLAGRLVHAQESERRRIERDIHDGAQQELVALVAKLGLARSRVRDGSLDEASLVDLQRDAQAILRDLREFAQGIHPSVLTDGGLVEAIQDRCARLPLEVTFDTNIGRARFADDVEGAAYFFASEGLTNVLKHSEATRAAVRLHLADGWLGIEVQDDGRGLVPGPTGSGLTGLADRFEALGGSVSADSRGGQGTTLTGRLPLHRKADT
ncbi:MAG: sensor histidine kinase [Acidimicrobiia bacterium]